MKIALDAMGGDYAPTEIVAGAVQAVEKEDLEVILVGKEEQLQKELAKYNTRGKISIYPASEVIDMEEEPAAAIRKKKDSSIVVATDLVRKKKADGVVSAGSTGAQMASALLRLGRIEGIHRPAIGTLFPTTQVNPVLILDIGANTACKPLNLLQFAEMGKIYMEKIVGVANPRVGLLNIGEEETKGNELSKEAYQLLKQSSLNFIGNVEARHITSGVAEVIVCDGFVGNVVLKFAEGLASSLFSLLQKELSASLSRKIGAALALPAFKAVKKKLDFAEYGGAPLFGVKGVSIVCHGRSKAKAIKNALTLARKCIENNFVQTIAENITLRSGKDSENA